jgi:hypothetical protein
MDEDLRESVAKKVSKWFGEPVLSVEDEIMALIASYTEKEVEKAYDKVFKLAVKHSKELDHCTDDQVLYTADFLVEIQALKTLKEPTHE